jgi:hypothetical protein
MMGIKFDFFRLISIIEWNIYIIVIFHTHQTPENVFSRGEHFLKAKNRLLYDEIWMVFCLD